MIRKNLKRLYKWIDDDYVYLTCLFCLLQNGVLLRMVLDSVTGDLSDTRTRYLGSRPVKLFRIKMQGSESVSSAELRFIMLRFFPSILSSSKYGISMYFTFKRIVEVFMFLRDFPISRFLPCPVVHGWVTGTSHAFISPRCLTRRSSSPPVLPPSSAPRGS